MQVLAIDPSVNHLGWAVVKPGEVIQSGTINGPSLKTESIPSRIGWMVEALDDEVLQVPFDIVAIERPETWGSFKSQASRGSGDLQLLTLIVGALTFWATTIISSDAIHLIKVTSWKGQLPKRVTQARMEKKYSRKFGSDHESDAVGIGDYILEKEKTNATKGT